MSDSRQQLRQGVLTVPNAIALSAAAMAPVLAVVLNAPAAVPAAGAALPLSFAIAFVAAAFVGNTVVQFSRQFSTAGSFYTFNSRGLGPAAGFYTGWLFWMGYAILAPGLFSAFGAFFHDYLVATLRVFVPWWLLSLAAMVVVCWLSLRSIKASVNLDLTLLVIEVIIFLILGVLAVTNPASSNTGAVFLVASSRNGFSGVGLGVVFGLFILHRIRRGSHPRRGNAQPSTQHPAGRDRCAGFGRCVLCLMGTGYGSPEHFFETAKATLDRLRNDGDDAGRMMSIGLHPRITGNPARSDALARFIAYAQTFEDVTFMRRIDIARSFAQQVAKP